MVATVVPAVRKILTSGEISSYVVKWANIKNGDVCVPYSGPGWADRNAQVRGTAGAGLHVKWDGSNAGTPTDGQIKEVLPVDPTDYAPMTFDNTVIDMTATGWCQFDIIPLYMRPVVTGDGSTDVTIEMVVRRTN